MKDIQAMIAFTAEDFRASGDPGEQRRDRFIKAFPRNTARDAD
jgi:hypothetical protein